MHPLQVEIHSGLPEAYRRQAAEILYDAFQRKFASVISKADQAIAILEESMAASMALVAISDDRLVALAGVGHGGQGFLNWKRSAFLRQLGWLRGLPGYMLASTFIHPADNGQLMLECIAVSDSVRGQGVGTQLLDAVFALTQAEHLDAVQLDVIDTNPRARELYERLGFVATHTRHYPYFRRLLGLTAVTTMIKQV